MGFLPKLTTEQQLKVCEMLAHFKTQSEVRKEIKRLGVDINEAAVNYYRHSKKWSALISRFRDDYLSGIMEVPIAHKRIRLERLDSIYKSAVDRSELSVAKEVLRAAQDEIEHKSTLSITMNRIELISDDELKVKVRRIKEELLQLEAKKDNANFMRGLPQQEEVQTAEIGVCSEMPTL
jgi:hypothetical protein